MSAPPPAGAPASARPEPLDLAAVRRAAADGANAIPAIVDAVKAYASVGEITAALKDVLGAYREPVRF